MITNMNDIEKDLKNFCIENYGITECDYCIRAKECDDFIRRHNETPLFFGDLID